MSRFGHSAFQRSAIPLLIRFIARASALINSPLASPGPVAGVLRRIRPGHYSSASIYSALFQEFSSFLRVRCRLLRLSFQLLQRASARIFIPRLCRIRYNSAFALAAHRAFRFCRIARMRFSIFAAYATRWVHSILFRRAFRSLIPGICFCFRYFLLCIAYCITSH